MEEIKYNGEVLAKIVYSDDFDRHEFLSNDDDPLQVGVFRNDTGVEIVNHIHNVFNRETSKTQELIYVVKGSMQARIYNSCRELIAERTLTAPSMVYLISGGHGFTMLEDNTVFVESKNGPYFGVERDKVKF